MQQERDAEDTKRITTETTMSIEEETKQKIEEDRDTTKNGKLSPPRKTYV